MRNLHQSWEAFMSAPIRRFVFTLVVVLMWLSSVAALPNPMMARPTATMELSVVSIAAPGSNTVGLAWGGNQLWASDQQTDEISYFEEEAWVTLLAWDGEPGPLAWGNDGLWVVNEASKQIVRLEWESDALTRTTIPIPQTAVREVPSITGLAWDGNSLWLCTGCGLCSTIYQIDPETGVVLQSFFPGCVPRGLAVYREGLWTVAYSGPRKRPLLSRREMAPDPSVVRSLQQFFLLGPVPGVNPPGGFPDPPVDPSAIAIAGNRYWVVDRSTNVINAYHPDSIP